jgi:hypothetical protein
MERQFGEAIKAVQSAYVVYQQYGNPSRQVKALYNLYSIYVSAGDLLATKTIDDILTMLETQNIDQETEAGVLFGIQPGDFGNQAQLIVYRERLRQLKGFYEQRQEPINLGRCLLKLAAVEQKLTNTARMVEYAHAAEAYAETIPLPLRISYLSDLGFYLWNDSPQASFDHFMEAYDLTGSLSDPQHRYLLATVVSALVLDQAEQLDFERSYEKIKQAAEGAQSNEVRESFQASKEYLETFRK